jgi:hypothetical protein
VASAAGKDSGDGTTVVLIAIGSGLALVVIAVLWWRRRQTMDDVLPRG